uniref:Uncharacterized protein n=1 Tax=Arundo donax TaxID=35708 RepID=A0A0A8Z6I5_ARUDO
MIDRFLDTLCVLATVKVNSLRIKGGNEVHP